MYWQNPYIFKENCKKLFIYLIKKILSFQLLKFSYIFAIHYLIKKLFQVQINKDDKY